MVQSIFSELNTEQKWNIASSLIKSDHFFRKMDAIETYIQLSLHVLLKGHYTSSTYEAQLTGHEMSGH